MKIVFASNYYNHHQHALSQTLFRKSKGQFFFIATSEMREERKKLGYGQWAIPEFVLTAHKDDAQRQLCENYIWDADLVISGAAPEKLMFSRIRKGKLTFRYTERLLKKGFSPVKYIPQRLMMHLRNPRKKPVYLLCAGAYVAADHQKFGLFRNKAYKWGYFPETKAYENPEQLLAAKQKNQILWAGRLIDWKHPEYAILVAQRLKQEGIPFEMNIIGSGAMSQTLESLISQYKLTDCVHLLGSMKPEQVRQHMESAGIFLATSNKQEGWGAVVNEAMNSGCAVVASHAMGSVPYLIEHEKNGLIFQSENIDALYGMVKDLLEHPEKQAVLGRNAYETITALWNADVAAERLIHLSKRILAGEKYPDLYETGPCSRAEILQD